MRKNTGYYAVIPAHILFDENLSNNEKLLYAHISTLINMNGKCELSNTYFEKAMGASKRTIYRWLYNLEKRNYINREVKYKRGTKVISKRLITMVSPVTLPSDTDVTTPSDTDGTVLNTLTEVININKDFSFSLGKKMAIEETGENYKANLIAKIDSFLENIREQVTKLGKDMPPHLDADDFILALESGGYRYKNFWATYQSWHRKGIRDANKHSA